MARPKSNPDELLSEKLRLRMSPITRSNLANKSQAAGVGEAEFIRRLIDDAPLSSRSKIDPLLINDLNNYVTQLSGACNNINQLTRATHTGRDFQKFWRDIGLELKRDLKNGRGLLNRIVKEGRL